jgi:hypothetical protein
MTDETPEVIKLPLVWVDLEDADTRTVNQLLVQYHEGEFILTFGHVTPPLLLGTPEENAAQAKDIPYVAVKVVSKLAATPRKAQEFIEAMQKVLTGYEQQREREGG